MRVESTAGKDTVYQKNQDVQRQESQPQKEAKGAKVKDGAVFAGDMNLLQDPIAKKREEARKEAMGLISKQFQSDLEIDESMEKCNEHVDEVRKSNRHAGEEIARLEAEIEKYKEEYGASDAELTDMYEEIKYWKHQQYEGNKEIREDLETVRATKEALLKRTNDMTDAAAAAEDVMDAASDEIIGMLKKEAMDKMEEDRKEEQEKAEKLAEKKEEQEELIEKRKEQERLEELTKEAASATSEVDKEELQREIEEILAKQKLLQEDLKGLAVDTSI